MLFRQKFMNAARLMVGAAPLIVTTSPEMVDVETYSPLLNLIFRRDLGTMDERVSMHFMAFATEGLSHPKDQRWDIKAILDEGYYVQDVRHGMTYESMMDYMRTQELRIAHDSGFKGDLKTIAAQRRAVVAPDNVLAFV